MRQIGPERLKPAIIKDLLKWQDNLGDRGGLINYKIG